MTGLLGGLVSSTAVTLEYSRKSRDELDLGAPLAYGVIGACTVLVPRIIIVSSVLDGDVALRVAWMLALPMVAGAAIVAYGLSRARRSGETPVAPADNPLRLSAAIKMALAFQISLTLISLASRWGAAGLYPTAAFLGLTDVDALTVSMSRASADVGAVVAARAIALGVGANTVLKLGVASALGVGRFRRVAVASLALLGAAAVTGIAIAGPFE